MDCLGSQINTEEILLKELELLTACTYNEEENEVMLSSIKKENEINLSIPDPKSQSDIDKMEPNDAKRFNEATIAEVNGMKHKKVIN